MVDLAANVVKNMRQAQPPIGIHGLNFTYLLHNLLNYCQNFMDHAW